MRRSFAPQGILLLALLSLAVDAVASDSWVLLGTLAEGQGQGFAILQEGADEQHNYRQGATLPGGWTLARVRSRSVVIRGAGGEQVLYFGAAPRSRGVARPQRLKRPRGPSQKITIDRQEVVDASTDIPGLLNQVRIVPRRQGGRINGYAIEQLKSGGLAGRLGLRAGDLVTSINGVPLDERANGLELYKRFRNAPSVSVGLVRNGSPMSLEVQLR